MKSHLARGVSLAELKHRFEVCEHRKKRLISYLQGAKDKLLNREISREEYEEIATRKLKGRTIGEWINYYEHYALECQIRIRETKLGHKKQKITTSIFAIVFLSLLVFFVVYAGPALTGFAVQDESDSTRETYTDYVNERFEKSQEYQWKQGQEGTLNSLRISGKIIGDGNVKVYLGDLLIMDSGKLSEDKKIRGSLITGFAVDDSLPISNEESKIPEESSESSNETLSGTEPITQPTGEPITEPNSEPVEPSAEPIISGDPIEEPIEYSIEFSDFCAETCDLGKRELDKKNYTIRVEIDNAVLELDSILYGIAPFANETELNMSEISTSLVQGNATLGEVVQWTHTINASGPVSIEVALPKGASNVSVEKIKSNEKNDRTREMKAISIDKEGKASLKENRDESESKDKVKIELGADENVAFVRYYTNAPSSTEEEDLRSKRVNVAGHDEVHYTDVLVFSELNESWNVMNADKVKVYWEENESFLPTLSVKDKNNNSIYDYVEWIAPQLSNQTYTIIVITNAEHLDENRKFISDIFEEVRELDNVWSETIPDAHYVRVTFERNLTSSNDITIYPRTISGNPKIEVYEKDGSEIIAQFNQLEDNKYNKIFLTGLEGEQGTFDLKIFGGEVEFDHIIDPSTTFVPAPVTQLVQLGNVTEQTYNMILNETPTNSCYTGLNISGGLACRNVNGTTAGDAYFVWNITLPEYGTFSSVLITSISALATTNGTDNLRIALFNHTSKAWVTINWSKNPGNIYWNATMTFNFTSIHMLDFLLNSTRVIRVLSMNNGTANTNTDLQQDYFGAVFNYDAVPTSVLNAPANGTTITTNTMTLNGTFTDTEGLSSSTIFVWNQSGTIVSQNLTGRTNTFNTTNFTVVLPYGGTFFWNYKVNDTKNNQVFNSSNFTLIYNAPDATSPVANLNAPLNGSNATSKTNTFNATFTDNSALKNVTLYIYNATQTLINSTENRSITNAVNTTNITIILPYDGRFFWNYRVCDSSSNCAFNSTNLTFTVDSTAPNITVNQPQNATIGVPVIFNVTLYEDANLCNYTLNAGVTNNSMTNSNNRAFNATNATIADGSYLVRYFCWDAYNNLNSSVTRAFSVDASAPVIAYGTLTDSNNTFLNVSRVRINVTATDANLQSIVIFLQNTTTLINRTQTATSPNFVNITGLNDGRYLFNATANDTLGNTATAQTRTFVVDTLLPGVQYVANTNTSGIYTSSNVIYVNVTANDTNLANITIRLFNTSGFAIRENTTGTSPINMTYAALSDGVYYWNATAYDNASNVNVSETRNATIDTINPGINYTINTETNGSTLTRNNTMINVTANDTNLVNITIELFNATALINRTTTTSSPNFVNITDLPNGVYYFNATVYDSAMNVNATLNRTITISVAGANSAPNITYITINTSFSPTEDSYTEVQFNFTAWDAEGFGNLDAKGGRANFTRAGEAVRQNSTCYQLNTFATNYANYSCTIQMWYFDASSTWNIAALVNDSSNGVGQNTTATFTYNQLSAFTISPAALTWASLSPGTTNQSATTFLKLNNTGNKNITSGNVQINATNLRGETDTNKAIWAGNMSVAILNGSSIECNENTNQSAAFSPGVFTNATNGTLMVGNHSVAGVGTRNLYVCIRTIGSELSSQSYSTTNEGSWTIKILAIGLVASGLRRKKKKIKEDKVFQALSLLVDELREKHTLSKAETLSLLVNELKEKYDLSEEEISELTQTRKTIPVEIFSTEIGCLEALCKYLKENKNMSYHEIAEVLARDDRTIWTAYKKACEKRPAQFAASGEGLSVPLKIFKDRTKTVLESLVVHLKDVRGMRHTDIAKLIKRDQRNIGTSYARVKKRSR